MVGNKSINLFRTDFQQTHAEVFRKLKKKKKKKCTKEAQTNNKKSDLNVNSQHKRNNERKTITTEIFSVDPNFSKSGSTKTGKYFFKLINKHYIK